MTRVKNHLTFPDNTLNRIRKAVDEHDDPLDALVAVDDVLQSIGLPHVDPLYSADHEVAQVCLIYRTLAGRDYFPEMLGDIEDILDAEPETLDHPDN